MRYYSAPRRALRGVRQLLYPRRCPFCNAVLGSIRTCPDCAEEVDRLRRKPGIRLDASQHYLGGLSGAAAPFRYEGCVRRAILRAKYQAAPWTAVELVNKVNEINRLFVESDPEVGYRKDNTFSGRNFFVEPTFGIKFSLCRYVALNMSIAYEWDAVMQEHQSRNPDFPSTFKVDWSGYRAQAGLIFCLNLKK